MSNKILFIHMKKINKKENMYQMFKRLEFKDNWYALLNSFAKRKK